MMRIPASALLLTSMLVGVGLGISSPWARPAVAEHATTLDPLDHEACLSCHPVEAAQWQGSPHQTSFTEATFQTALTLEPRAYCRRCHAPEVDPARPATTGRAELGIACTTCHVHEGTILAAPGAAASDADAPHAIRRSRSFTTASACARCHEFPFPDNALRDHPLAMQRTVSEHAASRFAERSCADCHMPRDEDGRRSHAFLASRDPEFVRSAVRVEVQRMDATTLRVTLHPAEVGHAVPTGDLLRRIEVGAAAVATAGEGPARRRFLARHFGNRVQRNGARVRDERRDDRVPPDGPRVVELTVPEAEGHPIRWWVEYQRVAHQRSFDEADAVLDGSISLAEGTVPAPTELP